MFAPCKRANLCPPRQPMHAPAKGFEPVLTFSPKFVGNMRSPVAGAAAANFGVRHAGGPPSCLCCLSPHPSSVQVASSRRTPHVAAAARPPRCPRDQIASSLSARPPAARRRDRGGRAERPSAAKAQQPLPLETPRCEASELRGRSGRRLRDPAAIGMSRVARRRSVFCPGSKLFAAALAAGAPAAGAPPAAAGHVAWTVPFYTSCSTQQPVRASFKSTRPYHHERARAARSADPAPACAGGNRAHPPLRRSTGGGEVRARAAPSTQAGGNPCIPPRRGWSTGAGQGAAGCGHKSPLTRCRKWRYPGPFVPHARPAVLHLHVRRDSRLHCADVWDSRRADCVQAVRRSRSMRASVRPCMHALMHVCSMLHAVARAHVRKATPAPSSLTLARAPGDATCKQEGIIWGNRACCPYMTPPTATRHCKYLHLHLGGQGMPIQHDAARSYSTLGVLDSSKKCRHLQSLHASAHICTYLPRICHVSAVSTAHMQAGHRIKSCTRQHACTAGINARSACARLRCGYVAGLFVCVAFVRLCCGRGPLLTSEVLHQAASGASSGSPTAKTFSCIQHG
eukprot:347384-Chlamydomonas_euryale.AAC.6